MLVLSRRAGEEIVIPELGITVQVLRTKGNQVRIGIEAPDSIRILRGELAFEDVVETRNRLEDKFLEPIKVAP